jgi:hypothetical protein
MNDAGYNTALFRFATKEDARTRYHLASQT